MFFPCTLDGLPKHTGSRLWRCEWVARHWPQAQVYDGTQRLRDFGLFVFQKAYLSQTVERLLYQLARLREDGKPVRLGFDLCDPDFLSEVYRQRLLSVLPLFDFATAPTLALVEWLAEYLPAYHVPDGIDPAAVTVRRVFSATLTPTMAWMGYRGNTGALAEMAQTMTRCGLRGDVCAVDRPLPFEQFVAQLADYDILLNPRPSQPPYCYKSDNKTLLAWAAGVAVARDGAELEGLLVPEKRRQQVEAGQLYVAGQGNIANTIEGWRRVCQCEGLV